MGKNKIRSILHLSDIHIRRLHRHREYREVFNRLYSKTEKLDPDLIFIGGDIVHGKNHLSPELTRMVATFILRLSRLADDVVIIPGNHDCLLHNKSREDALSPIVDLVQKIVSNVHYWKESGEYVIKNVSFGVLSIFDIDKDKNQLTTGLPDPDKMDNEYKIALFHGPVGKVSTDTGFQLFTDKVTVDTFEKYDILMASDIHKKQQLSTYNKDIGSPSVWYCGSLLQQNFSEEPSKGMLHWDLEKRTPRYIQLENNYGFKTITVKDGVIQNKMRFVPPRGNIRIQYSNTTLEQIKNIQIELRTKYPDLKEIKLENQDILIRIEKDTTISRINIGNVRDIEYQNKLISEFLKHNVDNIDKSSIKRICKINEVTNNTPEIYSGDIARNVSWKLKSFEFDNMFCYGKGNKIDFGKMNGLVGLVGQNRVGKTAAISSLSYTIFDTCDRTRQAINILNNQSKYFRAKLNIEINGEDYWIEREGKLRSRKNRQTKEITYTCPVGAKFYSIADNKKIDLTGAARKNTQYGSGTNEEIRRLLGTFDDFVLTSLSLQTNSSNFVDKQQRERKQILFQFMDLNIFDSLYDIAKIDIEEDRSMLKILKQTDNYAELANIEQQLIQYRQEEKELSEQVNITENKIKIAEEERLTLIKSLWKIDGEIIDIETAESILSILENDQFQLEQILCEDKEYKETLRPLYIEYHDKLDMLDEELINSNFEKFQILQRDLDFNNGDLKTIELSVQSIQESLRELNKYRYDPNCSYCLNNAGEHIRHQQQLEKDLKISEQQKEKIQDEQHILRSKIDSIDTAVTDREEYDILVDELNQISQDAIKIGGKISTKEEKLKRIEREITNTKEKINVYYGSEEKIKQNQTTSKRIKAIEDNLETLKSELDKIEIKYRDLISSLAIARKEKENFENNIQEQLRIEQKVQDYDLYMMAISKDNIPYSLVTQTIPAIEAEINKVLGAMQAGFELKLVMDGKNIAIHICYAEQCWDLAMGSGMELFISNLAIRVGLINASNLPRSSMLVIDEGMGALDSSNLANMDNVFGYLRTQFDTVLVISHLEEIKDYLDHLLSIDVDKKGFSKIISG